MSASPLATSEPVLATMTVGTAATNAITGAILYLLHHFTHANIDPAPVMAAVNTLVIVGLSVVTRGKVTPTETVGALVSQAQSEAEAGGRSKALSELRQLAGPVAAAAGVDPAVVVDQFLARIGAALAPKLVTAPMTVSQVPVVASTPQVPPVGPPPAG